MSTNTCTDRTVGLAVGEAFKMSALVTLAARRASLVLRGRRALLLALLERGEETVDVVRAAVELPAGVAPTLFGAVPAELARAGIIRADGYAKTTRATAHARRLTVWKITDRAAAQAWLALHPEETSPEPAGGGLADSPSHEPADGQPVGHRHTLLFSETSP